MASAGSRKTSSHYNVYTWVAKAWDGRKKRKPCIAWKSRIRFPKNPYLDYKGKKPQTISSKNHPKLLIKAKTRKEGPYA